MLRIHQNTKKCHTDETDERIWGNARVSQTKKGEVALS
jgi:hypothetical protein